MCGVAAAALALTPADAFAHVTRLEILNVTNVSGTGPNADRTAHQVISGRVHGELDPSDPKNAIITDIALAPRNARGRVEYVSTFAMIKPLNSSGVLVYSVVNRGSGAPVLSPEGHISVVSGWQGDLVATAGTQTIEVPVAHNRDGSSLTGPLVARFTNVTGNTAPLVIPRNRPSPYPPASLNTANATLMSAASENAAGTKGGVRLILPNAWAFADCSTTPFPGTPDPTKICLKNGFDPARLYELRYTVKNPLVLGIGLAAVRDLNAFLRYETRDEAGTPNPLAGAVRWAIAEGTSQSGTFLKLSLMLGFNQDERGRIVFDGINPNVAGRVTDLNRRFAMPSGHVLLYELGYEAPVWWEDWNDTARGRGTAGLLDRCRATKTCPKVLETFGASEMWGLRQSIVLTGTTADADLPLPDNVRRYYFAGVTHNGGGGGFSVQTPAVGGCELPSNPAPTAPMRAALLADFIEWITAGTPMPPSVYPRLANHTLVAPSRGAMGFPDIPERPSPDHVIHPLLDYDLGPTFGYRDQTGALTTWPVVKRALPLLVARTDADGNEVAGVKSPLVAAPLGTYTGWNVLSSGISKGQMCIFGGPVGGFIPFAATRAERIAARDPRPSLEERYKTHDAYVQAVRTAANALVRDRFLFQADADAMVAQAAASDVLK